MIEGRSMSKKIALSAGHHNTTPGANPIEKTITGPVTRALAIACRAAGFDVRVVTPDEGLGTFPGPLDKVAATVVAWAQGGWIADVFLEVHAESTGVRGCFAVYPDWTGDTDTIVRDTLGPALAAAIRTATTIPVRFNGALSEKLTSVGASGARLGIFGGTRSLKTGTRRLIMEVGSYGTSADLKIMQAPGFPDRIGQAMASALATWAGVAPPATPDRQVIGMARPSLSLIQFSGALRRHTAPLTTVEMAFLYGVCQQLQVDPGFMVAVWKHEGGSPLGGSALQRLSHMPINVKAAEGEHRPTVPFNGARWLWAETYQLGMLYSIWHIKNYHGSAGRLTVRQIIPVHAPASDGNDPERFISSILEDMAYMERQP
jgi:N-acetylmuramoyl-L-alanine amidase